MIAVAAHCVLVGLVVLSLPNVSLAHAAPGSGVEPVWTFPRGVMLTLAGLSVLYALGWRRLRRPGLRAGDTGQASRGKLGRMPPLLFAAAIAVLVVALASPIDALADSLQWAHMIQHTLLMMVAAPIFVLSAPAYFILSALPRLLRRPLGRLYRRFDVDSNFLRVRPILALVLYAVTLWLWHLPVLYEATLHNELLHDLSHLMFFLSSCLLWWVILHPLRYRRLDYGIAIAYLFVTSLHSTALGALTALSPQLLYPSYELTAGAFGVSPIEDQQIAGYIMWMPAGLSYVAAAVYFAHRWLTQSVEAHNR